jgi:WD40 repeat protein
MPSRTAWAAAFSGDGRWLAIGGEDRVVSVWSMAELPQIGDPLEFRGLSGTVVKTSFSRDGRILYALGGDFSCRRWEFNGNASGAIPVTSAAGDTPVGGLSVSPDGRWIAGVPARGSTAAGGEDALRFFDATNGLVEYHLRGQPFPTSTAFSLDGRWFASTGRDARVRLWDCTALTAALLAGSPVPEPIVLHAEGTRERYDCFVAFHPAGRLYCATGDGDLFEWNLKAADISATMRHHQVHSIHYLLPGIAVSPDGHWLAVGRHGWDTVPRKDSTQAGNLVLVFDVSDPDAMVPKYELRAHHRELGTVAFSQDSRWLAGGAQDGPSDVWDLHAMDVARSARVSPVSAHLLLGVSFSPASSDRRRTKWLALGGSDGRLHLWDWQRGAAALRTVETSEPIHSTVFMPDGRIATGSADGRVRIWETDPEKLIELARRTAGRELLPAEKDRFLRQR